MGPAYKGEEAGGGASLEGVCGSADVGVCFEYAYGTPSGGKQRGGAQPAEAGPDDDGIVCRGLGGGGGRGRERGAGRAVSAG